MTEQDWLASEDPAAMLQWLHERGLDCEDWQVSDRKLRLFAVACCRCPPTWRCLEDQQRGAVLVAERYADGEVTPSELGQWSHVGPVAWEVGEVVAMETSRWCRLARWDGDPAEGRSVQAQLLRDIVGNPFRPVVLPKRRLLVPIGPFEIDAGTIGQGYGEEYCPWLTPTVLALAQAAYGERERKCEKCKGRGFFWGDAYYDTPAERHECGTCHGTGRTNDGALDPFRLAVLADALEEAGCADVPCPTCPCEEIDDHLSPWWKVRCPTCNGAWRVPHPLLAHLRSPGPHARGCWALDLLLGKA